MLRITSAVVSCALAVILTGCASPADPPSSETIGSTSQPLGPAFDYSVSTRSPVQDNVIVTATASIGSPGRVPPESAGLCWITRISGSFRGLNEFAQIRRSPSGYYQAAVRSSSTFDGVRGAGPAMTMRCRRLTDFMPAALVEDFATDMNAVSVDATGGGPDYVAWGSPARGGAFWPWSGFDGRLGPSGNWAWNFSHANRTITQLSTGIATACPLTPATLCSSSAIAWETYSISGTRSWSYSVTGNTSHNNNDITLVHGINNECFIDGIFGHWTATTEARVYIGQDNHWHLSTSMGQSTGMGARAACFQIVQF